MDEVFGPVWSRQMAQFPNIRTDRKWLHDALSQVTALDLIQTVD
jgi:hypothetical protein